MHVSTSQVEREEYDRTCLWCKWRQVPPSEFVLIAIDGTEDWAGQLHGHCVNCAAYCNDGFHNDCGWDLKAGAKFIKKAWKARSDRIAAIAGIANDRTLKFRGIAA